MNEKMPMAYEKAAMARDAERKYRENLVATLPEHFSAGTLHECLKEGFGDNYTVIVAWGSREAAQIIGALDGYWWHAEALDDTAVAVVFDQISFCDVPFIELCKDSGADFTVVKEGK